MRFCCEQLQENKHIILFCTKLKIKCDTAIIFFKCHNLRMLYHFYSYHICEKCFDTVLWGRGGVNAWFSPFLLFCADILTFDYFLVYPTFSVLKIHSLCFKRNEMFISSIKFVWENIRFLEGSKRMSRKELFILTLPCINSFILCIFQDFSRTLRSQLNKVTGENCHIICNKLKNILTSCDQQATDDHIAMLAKMLLQKVGFYP